MDKACAVVDGLEFDTFPFHFRFTTPFLRDDDFLRLARPGGHFPRFNAGAADEHLDDPPAADSRQREPTVRIRNRVGDRRGQLRAVQGVR